MAILQASSIGLGKKLLLLNRQARVNGSGKVRDDHTDDDYVTIDTGEGWSGARPAARPAASVEPASSRSYLRAVPSSAPEDVLESEFERAQQMLSQGMTIAQVVRQTELTRSEAELIQLLHPLAGKGY